MKRSTVLMIVYWLAALLLAVTAVMLNLLTKVDVSVGASLLLTAALVWVTWSYTRATHQMAKSQSDQVQLLIDERETARYAREYEKVEAVWKLGMERVADINDPVTVLEHWFRLGTNMPNSAEAHRESMTARVTSMVELSDRFYSISPSLPSSIKPVVDDFRHSLRTLALAIGQMYRAIARARSQASRTTVHLTLSDVAARWNQDELSVDGGADWSRLADGSYYQEVRGTYSKMMAMAMGMVSGDIPIERFQADDVDAP